MDSPAFSVQRSPSSTAVTSRAPLMQSPNPNLHLIPWFSRWQPRVPSLLLRLCLTAPLPIGPSHRRNGLRNEIGCRWPTNRPRSERPCSGRSLHRHLQMELPGPWPADWSHLVHAGLHSCPLPVRFFGNFFGNFSSKISKQSTAWVGHVAVCILGQPVSSRVDRTCSHCGLLPLISWSSCAGSHAREVSRGRSSEGMVPSTRPPQTRELLTFPTVPRVPLPSECPDLPEATTSVMRCHLRCVF